jgi:hypothetical protein
MAETVTFMPDASLLLRATPTRAVVATTTTSTRPATWLEPTTWPAWAKWTAAGVGTLTIAGAVVLLATRRRRGDRRARRK